MNDGQEVYAQWEAKQRAKRGPLPPDPGQSAREWSALMNQHRRCQQCTAPGRARKHAGTVLYLCRRHWREIQIPPLTEEK